MRRWCLIPLAFLGGSPRIAPVETMTSERRTRPLWGGAGVGSGGESGTFQNDTPLYNTLIVAEDLVDGNGDGLVDDPDDADLAGEFIDFDFSSINQNNNGNGNGNGKNGSGTVTVNSVTVMDVERSEFIGDAILLFRPGQPTAFISVPYTGDNGVVVIDGIGLSGVDRMRIKLNGSAAIEGIVFEEDQPGVCWITTGGFHNAGYQSGGKDFTFGGNVGPPPSGAWQVINHNTGDNFHTNDVHIVECRELQGTTGPGQPGGKKGLVTNQAFFEGTGRLNGVDGFPFSGYVIDAGEPQGKKGNDSDYFKIVVYDPYTSVEMFKASGYLDGGNVQIHPPNPSL